MRKTRQKNNPASLLPVSLWGKAAPFLVLTASFLVCFWRWFPNFSSKVFLSLDSTVLYYPIYYWVHQHLTQDKLPLICDLAYHGAPVAAVSMAGVLSPFLWLFHSVSSMVVLANLLFLVPFPIFLFGAYFLGRRLKLSVSASLLLAFLWTYNGQRMAQLDHWNVAWACAFFPWAFQALIRYLEEGQTYWLLLSGLFWGLNLLSGHPQIFFLEGLFFLAWILFSPSPLHFAPRTFRLAMIALVALVVASPLILFTIENLGMDGFHFQWNEVDRLFHSWTPVNFITLVFPWFFGRDQYDRAGGDYWWQYQFVEMQVALSVAGLFFILLFFLNKNSQRLWVTITSLFGLSMAFGKFFFTYPLIQSLPVFSWFRDPARYWHLVTWAIGLGAAYAWDEWFEKDSLVPKGRKLTLCLSLFGVVVIGGGWFLLTTGRPLLQSIASWFIQHFLLGDSLHTQSLDTYLNRLPEKLNALAFNLDPRQPRVFLSLLFLFGLSLAVWNRKKWDLNFQKGFFLTLVFLDLMVFRMPLGNVFYNPADIPQPAYPAPQNRSLVLLYKNTSPLPNQYGEMAYPNWNLVSGRPNLVIDANPALPRYDFILKNLGWFSWVYKDRNPLAFENQVPILQLLGVDQIVSDTPINISEDFQTFQNHYPYVYTLRKTLLCPKAYLSLLGMDFDFKELTAPYIPPNPIFHVSLPTIINWKETNLSLTVTFDRPYLLEHDLILEKTFLPGWKAFVDEKEVKPFRCNTVLMGVPLTKANLKSNVELKFEPVSLRVGFFLFFLFFSAFAFFFLRRLLA